MCGAGNEEITRRVGELFKQLTLILETAAEGMTHNLADGPAQVSVFALICLPLGGAGASAGRA